MKECLKRGEVAPELLGSVCVHTHTCFQAWRTEINIKQKVHSLQ